MSQLDASAAVFSPGDPNRPLVLLLHGYNSNEADLAGLFDYLPAEFRYASLRAPIRREYGWAWFTLEREPGGFVLGDVRAGRSAVLDWCRTAGLAPVGAIGFSQGGALALELLRAGAPGLEWAAVLSGFVAPADSAETRAEDAALTERRPSVFWGHGLEDAQISPALVSGLADWLERQTTATVRHYAELGHSINAAELAELGDWLRERAREAAHS